MSDKTSDIGAVRLGALAVGVVVFGLGLGAFVSYLDAEQSQSNESEAAESKRDGADESSAAPSADDRNASAMHERPVRGLEPLREDVGEMSAAMNAAAHAADLGVSVGETAKTRASVDRSESKTDRNRVVHTEETPPDKANDPGGRDIEASRSADRRDDSEDAVGRASTQSAPQQHLDGKRDDVSETAAVSATGSPERWPAPEASQASSSTVVERGGRQPGAAVLAARGGEQEASSGGRAGSEGGDDETSDESEASDSSGDGEFTAENIARRIQKFYRNTEDFKANFKQVYRDIAAGDKKVRWGKVYFKTPGKMRWDYYEKEGLETRTKTLVSDGDYLWIYELEFKQVFKECLSEKQLPTSLKFLMGKGQLLEDFDVSFTDESTREAPELELKPKEPTPKYKKLHFKVDADAEQVTETTVFDPYGNTNTIHFEDVKLNSNLPDSGFAFEPPEDARLLNKNVSCD